MAFTQDFRTQRRNYADGETRIGEIGRLWYDPETNTIRVGDGVTPGGVIVSAAETANVDLSAVDQDIIPDGDITRSLGNPENRWLDLYVGPGSIFIGDIKLSVIDGRLHVTLGDGTPEIISLGLQGGIGFTGSQGLPGTSVVLKGAVSSVQVLNDIIDPVDGDLYVVTLTGEGYVRSGSTWSNVGAIQGPIGFTGSRGDTGFTGSQGAVGNRGFTGSQGDIGYVGSQGDTGFVGSQGYTGSQGNIGYTGSQGDIGYTGSQGFTGSRGETGFVGSQGDIGFTGSIGYTGSQGDTGFVGSQGDIGFTGSAGQNGVIGRDGYTGSQGEVGFVGSQGIQGDIGYTGSGGQDGVIGRDGYTGSQGDIGYTGSSFAGDYVESISAGTGVTVTSGTGSNSTTTIEIGQAVGETDDVLFGNITLNTGGSLTFANGSVQTTKAPQIYTNADAELGLSIDDLFPGDYYYDDTTESIYIMVDTGLGYNQLLDLTVRA